jgi:hypothetical protein
MEQNAQDMTAPVVRVFYAIEARRYLKPVRLDLGRSTDRIVGRESRADWDEARLERLWQEDGAG